MGTLPTGKISLLRVNEMRDSTPLASAIDSFFVNRAMKPKTHDFYSTHFRGFMSFVQDTGHEATVSDLNREYANTYLRMLEAKPTARYPKGSPFRARAAATSLKVLANWLTDEGVFKGESPLRKVKKAKELGDVRQPLSDDELSRVLDATAGPGDKVYTLVVFLAGTGLRLNEVREARVSDLSLRDCSHIVRAEVCKVGVARTVVFHVGVARALDKYLRTAELRPDDPLFPTDEGSVYTEGGLGKVFQRLAASSGVRRFHAHLLRHTWATNFMLGEGANLLQLKRQGGWKRMEMVERYSHATPANRETLPDPAAKRKVVRFKREAV